MPLRNSSVPRSPPPASETASWKGKERTHSVQWELSFNYLFSMHQKYQALTWGNKSKGDELGPPEAGGAACSASDPTPDKLVAGTTTVSGIP